MNVTSLISAFLSFVIASPFIFLRRNEGITISPFRIPTSIISSVPNLAKHIDKLCYILAYL
jgi:hypothetical protein